MTKVSVIIPTYNRSNYLQIAIQSILSQGFQDFEIVISDNASTDDTEDIVKKFNDSRVKYYKNPENFGVVKNHNLALEKCTGEYIHVFSDDDIMLENCLSDKVSILDNYEQVVLVHSDIKIINGIGQITSDLHWAIDFQKDWSLFHSNDRLFKGWQYFKIMYNEWNVISMPSVLVRKSAVEQALFFDSGSYYYCDWLLWMKICILGDVYYINKKLIQYRFHEKNTITQSTDEQYQKELFYIKNEIKKYCNLYGGKVFKDLTAKKITKKDTDNQYKKYPLKEQNKSILLFIRHFFRNIIKI